MNTTVDHKCLDPQVHFTYSYNMPTRKTYVKDLEAHDLEVRLHVFSSYDMPTRKTFLLRVYRGTHPLTSLSASPTPHSSILDLYDTAWCSTTRLTGSSISMHLS